MKLKEYGLFSEEGKSFLCGPTCTVNLVQDVLQKKLSLTFNPAKEVKEIVDKLAPELGISPQEFKNEGIDPHNLANLIRLYLNKKAITTEVDWKGLKTMNEPPNLDARGKKIVLYRFWNEQPLETLKHSGPDSTEIGSHYVILSRKIGENVYEFEDPGKYPVEKRRAVVEPVTVGKEGVKTYRLRFLDNSKSTKIILLTDIITFSP